MRYFKFLLIVLIFLAISCIKDDEEKKIDTVLISADLTKEYFENDIIEIKVFIYSNSVEMSLSNKEVFYYLNSQNQSTNKIELKKTGKNEIFCIVDGIQSNYIQLDVKTSSNQERLDIKIDKNKILSDGVDYTNIIASYYDRYGKYQEKNIDIYVDDVLISGFSFSSSIEGIYKVYAKYNDIKSEIKYIRVGNYLGIKEIIISVDKDSFIVDQDDSVLITSKVIDENDEEIKDIFLTFFAGDVKLNYNGFKTNIPGNYIVYAKYGEIESNKIEIKVYDKPTLSKITIVSDKTEIINDNKDYCQFSYEAFDQSGNIFLLNGVDYYINDNLIQDNVFRGIDIGIYKVYAKYENLISNEIEIEIKEKVFNINSLELVLDKTGIFSNGKDEVTITVIAYNEKNESINIDEYEIYVNNRIYEGKTFTSKISGLFTLYVKANGFKSDEKNVTVIKQVPYEVVIILNKKEILNDNRDELVINYKVFDQFGVEIENVIAEVFVGSQKNI